MATPYGAELTKSPEGSPEQLHWPRPSGSPGKEAGDWDSESGAPAKDGVTKMHMHVKDQGSARCLTAAGPGRTAQCREMHLASGVRQSHLPARAQTASLLPCAWSPTRFQGVQSASAQGCGQGHTRPGTQSPHKGPGRHLPSFLCFCPRSEG